MFKSNKLSVILGSLLATIILVAACSNQKAGTEIKDEKWQWAAFFENEPASQSVVPDPVNYTLMLNSDGTLNIQADCNMVSGSYTLEGNSLALALGPSTMAFCGEQSLDMLFIESLSNVESYAIENNQLVLTLKNNAGKMTFNK
jgi:heat shock protein HslJ